MAALVGAGGAMSRFKTVSGAMAGELAKPYEYGRADCFMMGCAIVDALQGTAYTSMYGGRYTTLAGAQKALRKEGCKSLATFFEVKIGLNPIPASFATIGDIAVLEVMHGGRLAEHVAIFIGTKFTTKTELGPASYGFEAVKACFKV